MSALKALLLEEYDLLREVSRLRRRLDGLPAGCLSVKTISGRRYAYVVQRLMGKLRFTYIGPADGREAVETRLKILRRRKYKPALRRGERELRRVQNALSKYREAERPEINWDIVRKLPTPGRRDFGEVGPGVHDSILMMKGRATVKWLS